MCVAPNNDKPATTPEAKAASGDAKPQSPAAARALAEAQARRAEIDRANAAKTAERGGRDGPEPVRYGDWEIKGLASDF